MQSKAPHALCDRCPFQNRKFAKTTGDPNSKLALVSRSPGYHEALNGKSFFGPSGKVLDHLLQLQGLERSEVLTTNVVLCQSDGTEPGWGVAAACCSPRLEAEISGADTVIAAGAEAVTALLGGGSIARLRGYPHERQVNGGPPQKVVVTNNPAVVLRDDASFPELVRDFRLAINPLPQPKLPKVKWTEDIDEAKQWAETMLSQIEPGMLVASDLEARGIDGEKDGGLSQFAEVVCAGFSIRPERAIVFGESVCLDTQFRTDYLRRLYEIEGVSYLWHNGKYDVKVLRQYGIHARVDEDTMLLSYALDERPGDPESGAGGHSLEWLLKDELGWPKYEPDSVRDFKKTGVLPDKRARIDLYEYNGMDTCGALGLFTPFKLQAINDNVWNKPYRSTLIRLSEAFTQVEMQGNLFDADEASNLLEDQAYPRLRAQRASMRSVSGRPTLNPNSPKQLVDLMYDEWGFEHTLVRGKIERLGKRSTDKWVRAEVLETDNYTVTNIGREQFVGFVTLLNDFKSLGNWKGATEGYVLRRAPNGRLYTDFKIHGTGSGRVSSSNPNLQNVTRPKEGLPNIRSCFLADPGCSLISGDLNQAELRAISVLSGDESLQAVYLETNRSLHKEIATEFYGSNYTYEQYVRAKNINFGVAYWQSAYSFAQMYHMPQEEAQKFIDFWFDRFPGVYAWTKKMEKQVLTEGEIQSPFGHKRRFYVIPSDQSARIHVVKEGINFLPQNIAAYITLSAMASLVDKLDPAIAQVRLTVHDNIVVNARDSHIEEVAAQMKVEMESAAKREIDWDFPFTAEISVGSNWGNLQDLEI